MSRSRPQNPTAGQVAELEIAGQLQMPASPEWVETQDGKAVVQIQLPRQGLLFLRLSWWEGRGLHFFMILFYVIRPLNFGLFRWVN